MLKTIGRVTAALTVTAGLAAAARATVQEVRRRRVHAALPPAGINTVERVMLGGAEQWLLIQSHNTANPVLLVLHGGPAMNAPGVAMRGLDFTVATATRELVKHYTVVFWDQRASGKSRGGDIPEESVTFERMVQDTVELIDYLRAKFNQEKIVLAGLSWGSALGLTVAAQHPEKLHAYVGLAQITNWLEADRIDYCWVLERARALGKTKMVRALETLGLPPYATLDTWGQLRRHLMQLGAITYAAPGVRPPSTLKDYVLPLLTSPDYTIGDALYTLVGSIKRSYTPRMIEDINTIDLFASVPRVEVPVHILHGRHDTWVPSELTAEYFERLHAPYGKRLTWLEKSSHFFHHDDQRVVERYLIDKVLADVCVRP